MEQSTPYGCKGTRGSIEVLIAEPGPPGVLSTLPVSLQPAFSWVGRALATTEPRWASSSPGSPQRAGGHELPPLPAQGREISRSEGAETREGEAWAVGPGEGQDGPGCKQDEACKQGSSWDKFSPLGLQLQRGRTQCQGIVERRRGERS